MINDKNKARRMLFYRLLPLLVFIALWQLATHDNPNRSFFFGSPSRIGGYFVSRIADGSLLRDVSATAIEAFLGFVLGNVTGTAIGLGLWYSKLAMKIARPYVITLGAVPVIVLAPILIVWFGTGLLSKVMVAALSTVFVALSSAYTGASDVSRDYLRLMQSLGADKHQTFRKVVAPASIVWVMSAFRLNIGFAILGAFLGEFISSTVGLGHLILVASGLFDISLVLLGAGLLSGVALVFYFLIGLLEPPLKRLVVRFS